MNSENQKTIITIEESKYANWKLCLKNKLRILKSNLIEIDCKDLELSCADISEIEDIANQNNCKITCFCSTSTKTIVSSQSLGYRSQFIVQNCSNSALQMNEQNLIFSKHMNIVKILLYLI